MFTPIPGEEDETHFDGSHIFQMGRFNHQLDMHFLRGRDIGPPQGKRMQPLRRQHHRGAKMASGDGVGG